MQAAIFITDSNAVLLNTYRLFLVLVVRVTSLVLRNGTELRITFFKQRDAVETSYFL